MPYNAASNPSGPFTVELWAKPARVVSDLFCPAASVDASQNGGLSRFGWIFYQTPASTWEFRVGGFNGYVLTNSSGSAEIGAWNHLVGVYDGANASFYVNGQLVEGPSVATGFSPNTNNTIPLRLGATTLTNRTFDGWVDEVAFYANALGADRIAAHYNTASSDVSGYAAQVLADQPLGYWHLDEPAYATPGGLLPGALNLGWLGSAANGLYEPGALPGVPGVPSPVFGQSNYACQLNGPGYIDMAGWALNFTGPLSLALWIKANPANGSLQTIASKGASSYRLILDGTGHPRFADGGQPSGDVIGPARIDDGAWHQLIGVYDGANTESLYVDGQLAASTNGATAAVAGNGSDFLIGVNPDEALVPLFNGVVDEVCIFTNALSAAQVQQLFLAAIPALPAPPVFQRITHVGGAVLLTWSAVAGKVYQVQYNTALTQTNWNNLGNAITATNSALSASDVMPGSQRFYRVLLLR